MSHVATFLVIAVVFADCLHGKTIRVPEQHKTIQSGIDAASAGDTVIVSPGTYKERIHLKDGVIVRSAGDDTKGRLGLRRAEQTIIDGGGNGDESAGVTMAEGSVLDGITVTNVGTYDDELWQKHHATHGNDQSHEHIGAPGKPGIRIEGVNCRVVNNIVHHIGYTGIAVQGVAKMQVRPHVLRNVCYRNMGGGIGSMKKSTALIESNICFQNFYAGIGHDDSSPIVLNNLCYENIRAGIGISEGSCPIVRGNKCYLNRRAGIGSRTGRTTRPLIEDNDCYENEMAGIGAEEEASPVIRANRCYRNKLAGIGARKHAMPTIVNNECYENEKVGIGQESDAVTTLIGNNCHHNKEAGLGFAPCEHGRSLVIGNAITDNAKVAAGVNAGWTVTFSKNEMSRKGGLPPIVMVFEGATATFSDNVIRGGGVAGIRVAGKIRAAGNRFIGTSLRKAGPPNFAVWALPGSSVFLTENTMTDWRHALHGTESTVHVSGNTVERFHKAAFVIVKATSPVTIFNNTAVSDDEAVEVVRLTESPGIVSGNESVRPE